MRQQVSRVVSALGFDYLDYRAVALTSYFVATSFEYNTLSCLCRYLME